ncbi:MAG: DsbA family protein [Bacteriovoracaceae bacterium]|jgi:protein-disulfide isomerase|nr:DsbA family protein [Bacteriovoracaceae bacterium]
MKMKSFKILAPALVAAVVILLACTKEVISGPAGPNFIFKPGAKSGVAAKVGTEEISIGELTSGIESEIYEAERKVYELKFNRLRSLLLEKMMKGDPNKKGLTNDQYMDKYIAKGIKIGKAEIEAFIKERKIPAQHVTPQIKERIKGFLETEKKKKAVDKWLGEKTAKNPVEVYIAKPSRPTFNVPVANDDPYKGGKNAKVVIVEFSDFQCPFCAKGADLTKQILKKYGDKVKFVYKNFPLPFHTQAHGAAQAALCAKEQSVDSFWKFHDTMFADQTKLALPDLKNTAKTLGLKTEQFAKCLDSKKYSKAVDDSLSEGKKVGVRSTPTFYVNGKLINGAQPLETFSEIIDEELKL